MDDRSSDCAAELISMKGRTREGEIVASIQIGEAHKLKNVTMELIGSWFCDDVDEPAHVVAILRIEIVRQDAELSDGIQTRNYRSSHVALFLHVSAVHHQAIGRLALSAYRQVARIEVARRIEARAVFAGRLRHHAGLKR